MVCLLAANIPLIQGNLVPLSFNDVVREDYASAIIAIYELQDVSPLADLYTFSYLRTCAQSDSTVKILGFDEIRVSFRDQRRALIREIILRKLKGEAQIQFLNSHASKLVKEDSREAFIEDAQEDLKEIDSSRIAGLGITVKELQNWINS